MQDLDLTPEEKRALAATKRLAQNWPTALMVILDAGIIYIAVPSEKWTAMIKSLAQFIGK